MGLVQYDSSDEDEEVPTPVASMNRHNPNVHPPPPPGTPPPTHAALTNKFDTFLRLKRTQHIHFNDRSRQQ
ncbi:hypothetical protein NEMBOFW57_002082 [Staphylotrichum longicolle]|uniref:Uncharacterized protein n=1 Tax=Staphylotrichum longicolle TaxID=669026 RepID=A0AAD4I269_9PEZI|nr:hypothetical protein NEMBOFW57_002082 [Staphylotrichum longicolle]